MIVKTTDFSLDAYIPNKDDAPFSDLIGNETELQGFIDTYEKEVLIRTLGYDLYIDYIANFESDGSYKPSTEQKWKDLTDGVGRYRGIKPIIIGYVFWKFIASDDSHYTSAHVVKEKTETANLVESRPKAIEQYRKFYEYCIGTYYNNPETFVKPSIFGNLRVVIFSGSGTYGSNFQSMYQFIFEHKEDYDKWQPESFRTQNYFDI